MLRCVTLWIGERLGMVERACLRSVTRQGHSVTLYCYAGPANIPEGVEVADAASILPESAIVRHKSGSVAPFSDWFRYELLRRGLGTWVDTDIYLLKPIDEDRPHLFGEERRGVINNAVLRLPPDSPVLDELLTPFAHTTPPWLAPRHRIATGLRRLLTGRIAIGEMPWGTTGPAALTAAARKFGLSTEALPAAVFYPVPWEKAEWILDPSQRLDDVVSDETVGLHLWNECIRGIKERPAPEGSFLKRLQEEGA